jgi:hypothetical protein
MVFTISMPIVLHRTPETCSIISGNRAFFPMFGSFSLLFYFCVCLQVYMHRWCFSTGNLLFSLFILSVNNIDIRNACRAISCLFFIFFVGMICLQNHGWIALSLRQLIYFIKKILLQISNHLDVILECARKWVAAFLSRIQK